MSKCGAHKKMPSSLRACHDFLPPWLTTVVSPVQNAVPLVCPTGRIQSSLLIGAGCLVRFPPCNCRSLTTNDYLSSGKLASALFPHSSLIQIKRSSTSRKAVIKVRPQRLFTHWHMTEAPCDSPMTLTSSCPHLRLHHLLSFLPYSLPSESAPATMYWLRQCIIQPMPAVTSFQVPETFASERQSRHHPPQGLKLTQHPMNTKCTHTTLHAYEWDTVVWLSPW